MVQITHQAISGYRIRMQNCLQDWKGQGNETITQEQLCECMNCKVRAPFRRHISEMQSEGLVTRFTYQTDNGGYKVAYVIN